MEQKNHSLGFLITDLSRLLRHAFEQQLEGSSLTLAEARALIYVSRNEGVRQVDLAELLEIKAITMTRLIDQLVNEGLVERRPDPQDRRAFLIYLTPAAEQQLMEIDKVIAVVRGRALQGVSEAEVAVLHLALNQMRSNLLAVD